jgi:hypothetical protein
MQDAQARGVDVVTIALTARQRPGLLGYMLPGLGRADRLWNEGRKAATGWLDAMRAGADAPLGD